MRSKVIPIALLVVMAAQALAPAGAAAQASAEVWRAFAEKVPAGSELIVRVAGSRRFTATLIGVREDALLLQPKTRVPVPVQAVPYGDILALERRQKGGVNAAKAVAIGVGSGVAVFFGILLFVFAAMD